MSRKISNTDRCHNCGQSRGAVRADRTECVVGHWDYDGEWKETQWWPRHRWAASASKEPTDAS